MSHFFVQNEETPEHKPIGDMPTGEFEMEEDIEEYDEAEVEAEEPVALTEAEELAQLLGRNQYYLPRGMVVLAWNLALPFIALWFLSMLMTGQWTWFVCSGFFLLTISKLNRLSADLERSRVALKFASIDRRYLGALTEALEAPTRRISRTAGVILTHLLPQLTEFDAELLNEDQLASLYHKLNPRTVNSDPELVLAILRALPNIGDTSALPYVERLTSMRGWTGNLRRVRAAARQCIPLLEQRVVRLYETEQALLVEEENVLAEAAVAPVKVEAPQQLSDRARRQLEEFEAERRKHSQPGMRFGFLIASYVCIVPYTAVQMVTSFTAGEWQYGVLWAAATALGTQFHRFTLSLSQASMARAIAKLNEKQLVGHLAEMLDYPDPEMRSTAAAALTNLLPRLNANDTNLLNVKQRACLYRMLKMSNANSDCDFILAILTALEQVGDKDAVPFVERLAKTNPWGIKQKKIRDAAAQCLPNLLDVANRTKESMTLLRASSSAGTTPEMLLRPVTAPPDVVPGEMLRAGARGDTGKDA